MGCVYAYVIILTLLGPEMKGRNLTVAYDQDMEEAAGHDAVENVTHLRDGQQRKSGSDEEGIEKM